MIKRKIKGGFRRLLGFSRIQKFKLLSSNKYTGHKPYLNQPILLMGSGEIKFGEKVKFGVRSSPDFWSSECYIEARSPDSSVEIGSNTWINNRFSAISEMSSISIGRDCLVGHDVFIIDSNFHSLNPDKRRSGEKHGSQSVFIGDNVFIGSRVTILKNTKVSDGSVIAAGSVVSGTFPPRSLISGNPAKLVRIL